MLEYFTYKKVKKHQAEKHSQTQVQTPLINEEDENFLERIVSAEGTPPPLPDRPSAETSDLPNRAHGLVEAGDPTGNKLQMVVHDGNEQQETVKENGKERDKTKDKGKGKEKEKPEKDARKANRFSFITRMGTKKQKKDDGLEPKPVVTPEEANKEEDDINRILDELNLSAVNNRAFSLSTESQQLVQKFTVILKDLINGVPTAYDDLTHLLDNSNGTLSKNYEKLPSFLQKLVTQLPNKLTSNLAPELLAVATEAQALNAAGVSTASSSGGGIAGAAKKFLTPTSLKDLVTKPGAVASMLKAIMNALKLRWPAFMGTNVLLSLGLFILLFVFWYCHKRGRETRLERERVTVVDSEGRIVELQDDPMLGEAGPSRAPTGSRSASAERGRSSGLDIGNQGNGNATTAGNDLRPDYRRTKEQKSRERTPVHANGKRKGK